MGVGSQPEIGGKRGVFSDRWLICWWRSGMGLPGYVPRAERGKERARLVGARARGLPAKSGEEVVGSSLTCWISLWSTRCRCLG